MHLCALTQAVVIYVKVTSADTLETEATYQWKLLILLESSEVKAFLLTTSFQPFQLLPCGVLDMLLSPSDILCCACCVSSSFAVLLLISFYLRMSPNSYISYLWSIWEGGSSCPEAGWISILSKGVRMEENNPYKSFSAGEEMSFSRSQERFSCSAGLLCSQVMVAKGERVTSEVMVAGWERNREWECERGTKIRWCWLSMSA